MHIYGSPPQDTGSTKTKRTLPADYKPPVYTAAPESTRVQTTIVPPKIKAAKVAEGDTVKTDTTHHAPTSTKYSPWKNIRYLYHATIPQTYEVEENLGINYRNARKVDICLAKYAKEIAEEFGTVGNCYTGGKYALWNAGIIDDYGDMPQGSAKDSIPYFRSHTEKFQEVKCKAEDLKYLPAGHIIVYTQDGVDGHFAITNGNGQEMSDSTDNMAWLEKHGKGAGFAVFKLTDNWKYNEQTKKLEFKAPMVDSTPRMKEKTTQSQTFIA